MIARFLQGFAFFLNGWKLLNSGKGLWHFVWIPLLISTGFFVAGLSFGFSIVPGLVTTALGFIFTTPEGWLYTLLWIPLVVLFGLVFLVSLSAVVYLLASVVGAPFNAILAERVLILQGVIKAEPFNLGRSIRLAYKMLLVSLIRAIVLVFASALLFLVSFVPGLNFVSAYLTLVILAFDASDYAFESLQWDLSTRIKFLKSHMPEYCGMAAQLAIFFLLPGAIVLLMPVIVIGISDQVARRSLRGTESNS